MNEALRLLEGWALERLSTEEALREIRRIAGKTLPNMSPGYYTERLRAIATLAEIAAERLGTQKAG